MLVMNHLNQVKGCHMLVMSHLNQVMRHHMFLMSHLNQVKRRHMFLMSHLNPDIGLHNSYYKCHGLSIYTENGYKLRLCSTGSVGLTRRALRRVLTEFVKVG